ncbi:MAG: transpeptidase family protein [Spirochaetaceae bacterium]|jgi:cell division protein FtsI (penicillin-binding protein 3)|nr:transpeptidase family protein [Spirochaetaceae bacterium]
MSGFSPNNGSPHPFKRRFIVVAALLSAAAFLVLLRYASLMFNPPSPEEINPPRPVLDRGAILDRNGRSLALQTRLGDIKIWKPNIRDKDALCRELAPLLGMSGEDLLRRIDTAVSNNVMVKRQVDEITLRAIEAAIGEGRLPGVGVDPIVGRIYPEDRLASQIIGFVGADQIGLEGIEYFFNDELAPKDGNGNQVVLTIDASVQYTLEEIGRRVLTENSAEAVMLLALDPRTGDMLGSASLPDFDPNNFRGSAPENRTNRSAVWAYEPGSVFKIYSLAALMDSQAITGQSTFFCNGRWERVTGRGERITIGCLGAHGTVNARDIIVQSCNAGAAYASERLDALSFYNRLKDFGFGMRTGAGNPGESAGSLSAPEYWSDRTKATLSMGQEISVSALQMLQAATAIANDGVMVSPKIVSRIISWNGKTVRNFETAPPRRVTGVETARAIRSYMVDVTSAGTGRRANVEDLSLAVKTGTAQISTPGSGYSETDYIASCIALVPAENPVLILYLVIVKPQGEYLAGRIAAPPVREAAEALVDYLGIPRGRNRRVEHSGSIILPPIDIPRMETSVPDFTGYSKKQILPLLLRDDVTIELYGEGWVLRQNPPPGTPFQPGMVITLQLE